MEHYLPAKSGEQKKPVSTASERDLMYWGKRLADGLEKDPTGRYAARDRELVAAIKDELKKRKRSADAAAEQQAKVLAKTSNLSLGKAVGDPASVTRTLQELSAAYHIVSPATRLDVLPQGCGVAISYVAVNPDVDTYKVGDKCALGLDTLKRIAAAANIEWDMHLSGRLDDGSDPHYCHYRAVGHVRNFDGSSRVVSGEVEIDAREGSPQIEEIRTKAARPDKDGKIRDPMGQIIELRKFLLRHAESKAKARAIADMGVKRAYTREELAKPFAVARLTWTGETSDPELRREFATKLADAMIGGKAALYGSNPPPQLAPRPAPAPQFSGHAPPPIAAPEDDGNPWDGAWSDDDPPSSKRPVAATASGENVGATPVAAPHADPLDRGDNPDDY